MERKKVHGNTKYWNLVNTYPIQELVDSNITEIQKMNKLEKAQNIKPLIQKIIEYGTDSNYEAIGLLQHVAEHFLLSAEENREHEEHSCKRQRKWA